MAKGNKRRAGRRSRGGDDSDKYDDDISEGSNHGDQKDETALNNNKNSLDFAQRRELQRKAAAEKRRSKQKCHLCGEAGHVRRECPGIDDDGRGESKFTKSKGDSGARSLKASSSKKKGVRNRGRKPSFSSKEQEELHVGLPPGFSAGSSKEKEEDSFVYYDAGCNHAATVEYLCSGRGKNKISLKEAVAEYQSSIETSGSNYGGCITRSVVKPGWVAAEATPFSKENVWFVVGVDCNSADCFDLLPTLIAENTDCIVGVFCDLDYSPGALSRWDRDSQLNRLRKMCQVASAEGLPIQIRTFPPPPAASESELLPSPYSQVMSDLMEVLSETTSAFPSLKIHLSCWSGRADHMNALLSMCTENNVFIGMDGTVSFSKASHAHECAFDVPLDRLLLDTGGTTIPSRVANAKGREAFCHSCLVPYIAEAVAQQKKRYTAEEIARAASANTMLLYPKLSQLHLQENSC